MRHPPSVSRDHDHTFVRDPDRRGANKALETTYMLSNPQRHDLRIEMCCLFGDACPLMPALILSADLNFQILNEMLGCWSLTQPQHH